MNMKKFFRERRYRKRLSRAARNEIKPVLIYQMGKVASTSIYSSLQTLRGFGVFHTHRLNYDLNQIDTEDVHRENDIEIRQRIVETDYPISIISLVREPISRNLSAYFQNIHRYFPGQERYKEIATDELIRAFFDKFDQDEPLTWFDREFQGMLGIDVFAHPFSYEEGYLSFRENRYSVLVMRHDLEDRKKASLISDFLGIRKLKIVRKNISKNKKYGEDYSRVKRSISFPEEYLEKMLTAKYTTHFFSDREIAELHRKYVQVNIE